MRRSTRGEALWMVVGIGLLIEASCVIDATKYTPVPPATAPTAPVPRLPQNGAYEGSTVTGALRPRFLWEASVADAGAITYELQYSADSTFTTGVITVQTAQPSHQPEAALAVSTTPPVGRRYYWRVRACVAEACSEYSPTWWVNLGRSTKDFNGDGYDDVVVGSHTTVSTPAKIGVVYVYFGGPGDTFDTSPDGIVSDSEDGSWFGYSASSAGDVNGDGFADVLVGAPKSDAGGIDSGAAYLYWGGPGSTFDVVADVPFLGKQTGEHFGESVSAAGDVNADGYSDVAIGAPLSNQGISAGGRVAVYFGEKAGAMTAPNATILGSLENERLGSGVSDAGDLNGDGASDLVVSKTGYLDGDSLLSCAAPVYLGGRGMAFDGTSDGVVAGGFNERCSFKGWGAGDVNGDGFSDVVARIGRSEGARLFLGSEHLEMLADTVVNLAASHRCREAAPVGDVNGDGAADVAVVDTSAAETRISVFLGRRDARSEALAVSPAATLVRAGNESLFGYMVRSAGDVNGDGFDDIIVSDPAYDLSTGRVDIYFGNGGATIDAVPDATMTSPRGTGTFFGESVH